MPGPAATVMAVVRKVSGVLVAAAAVLLVFGPGAEAKRALGTCQLPSAQPLWIDFADGSVPFWNLFAKPGVVAAASNLIYPPKLRAGGAKTVYFDLYLKNRVGTSSKPADPELIEARADKFYDYASQSMDCADPVIAENELFGAGLEVPWSPTNIQYRSNVLRFLQRLRERGARPWLLVNSRPYTAAEAGDWWRQVAEVAGIVREVYFPAPLIYKQGPILGSRTMRQSFRKGIIDFTRVGIPVSKLGIFLGFQTVRGVGGREGLAAKPWFQTVKWHVQAARTVALEMHFNSIWSWGWGQWQSIPGTIDPQKEPAACVYLWARDPTLCDGPGAVGKGFDTDRTEGALALPKGVRCKLGRSTVRWTAINPLLGLTDDPELAFSNAFARAVLQRVSPVSTKDVLAAERSIVASRFGGSRGAYLSAIASARTSLAVARGIIGDELHRVRISSRFRVSPPSATQIQDFLETYADLPARLVQLKHDADWLGGRASGYAVASSAPLRVMGIPSGRWSTVWSSAGAVEVRPLGDPQPLGLLPFTSVSAGARATLIAQARDARFPAWLASEQYSELPEAVCWRDQFPELGAVDLTSYLPFLALTS